MNIRVQKNQVSGAEVIYCGKSCWNRTVYVSLNSVEIMLKGTHCRYELLACNGHLYLARKSLMISVLSIFQSKLVWNTV